MRELLRELCLEFGPSGYTDRVLDIVEREIKSCGIDAYEKDELGNLILRIKNEGAPKLLINAHMDEVGFMVTGILESGLLKFGAVGGIDPLILSSKRVVSENGVIGCIVSKPVHLLSSEERDKRTEIEDMVIDIGASSRREAEELCLVGDYFTFLSDFCELGTDLVKCKALDDRLGVTIMLRLIKELSASKIKSKYDLYFAFTDREEVSFSGAFSVAEKIKPDYAVIIESKAVLDLYGIPKSKRVSSLGDGAIVSFADRATVYSRDLIRHIMALCEKNGIKYQVNKFISGGNDATKFQKGAGGAKVSTISAASRYIHSGANVVSYSDLCEIYKTVLAIICEEDEK